MSTVPYTWVLLGTTFFLSALWAAVLLVLVRLGEPRGSASARNHLGVELVWAVIPALLVLSVVVPTLQSGPALAADPDEGGARVAEVVRHSGQ